MARRIILVIRIERILLHFFFSFIFISTWSINRFLKYSNCIYRSPSFLFNNTVHNTLITHLGIIEHSDVCVCRANNNLINDWLPYYTDHTLLTNCNLVYLFTSSCIIYHDLPISKAFPYRSTSHN